MTLVLLAAGATLPLVLVTVLLGSTGVPARAELTGANASSAPGSEAALRPLRRALRDVPASGLPKEKIERPAAAELALITRGAK